MARGFRRFGSETSELEVADARAARRERRAQHLPQRDDADNRIPSNFLWRVTPVGRSGEAIECRLIGDRLQVSRRPIAEDGTPGPVKLSMVVADAEAWAECTKRIKHAGAMTWEDRSSRSDDPGFRWALRVRDGNGTSIDVRGDRWMPPGITEVPKAVAALMRAGTPVAPE